MTPTAPTLKDAAGNIISLAARDIYAVVTFERDSAEQIVDRIQYVDTHTSLLTGERTVRVVFTFGADRILPIVDGVATLTRVVLRDAPAPTPDPTPTESAMAEVAAGALFVVNHSGGKDSQRLLIFLQGIIPAKQLLVVHATLGEMEWAGALEHAQQQAEGAGVPFLVAEAGKTFLGMVGKRFEDRPEVPSWPSASHRQCTSDLKRNPIEREVRRYAAKHGFKRIVNCMGIRGAESPRRAKATVWGKNAAQSVAGREWFNWLPIHDMTTSEVLLGIKAAGQQLHPAYALGNERLSCVFCIMGSANDLRNGARHNPELYAKYVALEEATGYTMHQSRKSLAEIVNSQVN